MNTNKQLTRCRMALTIAGLLTLLPNVVEAQSEESTAAQLEIYRGIPYAKRGSTHLAADIYVPAGQGPFPGVLMVHGGGWVSGYREQMSHHARILAKNGFAVVTISYRLAPRFRFPDQLIDCRDALQWMREHAGQYKIDPGRMAGFGYSAGAQLICLLGYENQHRLGHLTVESSGESRSQLRAVIAGGTPCDLAKGTHGTLLLYVYLGGTSDQFPERYRQASPVAHLSAACPPSFFYHGEVDRLVPREGVLAMSSQLRDLGVRSEVYMVTGKGHIGAFHDDAAIERAAEFLTEVLDCERSRAAAPDVNDGGE